TGAAHGECVTAACESESAVISSEFPRLSHAQWGNSVRDLLFLGVAPDVSGFTTDAQTGTKFDNNGGKLEVSQGVWGDYQVAAEKVAAELVADDARMAKLTPANLASDPAQQARAFVSAFGRRAYRRPLTSAEVDAHAALFAQGATLFPDVD